MCIDSVSFVGRCSVFELHNKNLSSSQPPAGSAHSAAQRIITLPSYQATTKKCFATSHNFQHHTT